MPQTSQFKEINELYIIFLANKKAFEVLIL